MLPVKIFISYSHKDSWLFNEFKTHLEALRKGRIIDAWHDQEIRAGSLFDAEIKERLQSSKIVVLLVSSNFIQSDYCLDEEYKMAREGLLTIVPIIVRACNWNVYNLKDFKAIPNNGSPVFKGDQDREKPEARDEAWVEVIEELRKVIIKNRSEENFKKEKEFTVLLSNENLFPTLAELSGGYEQGSQFRSFYLLPELRFGTLDLMIKKDSLVLINVCEAFLQLELSQCTIAPGERLGDKEADINIAASGGNKWVFKGPAPTGILERKWLGEARLCTLIVDDKKSKNVFENQQYRASINIKLILRSMDLVVKYSDQEKESIHINKKRVLTILFGKSLGMKAGQLTVCNSKMELLEKSNENE